MSSNSEEYTESNMAAVLTELRNLRKEHTEASRDTKTTLYRVESTLNDVMEGTAKLEQQVVEVATIRYLLCREAKLSAKCEDLESRARRNNLRIYGVKEGEERNDMINFITNLMRTSLDLPDELDLCVERAHRSLTMKPRDCPSKRLQSQRKDTSTSLERARGDIKDRMSFLTRTTHRTYRRNVSRYRRSSNNLRRKK